METVKLSPKFQVVIPKDVRERMGLRAGRRFMVFSSGNVIQLVPVKTADELFGFAKGIDTSVERDEDRV